MCGKKHTVLVCQCSNQSLRSSLDHNKDIISFIKRPLYIVAGVIEARRVGRL